MREFHYRWEYELESSPQQLWPLISDTNRFNRDTGVPEIATVAAAGKSLRNARRRLRLSAFGIPVEWEEQPFEWVRPHRFGVRRRYTSGPIAQLRVTAELIPREPEPEAAVDAPAGRPGTKLVYEVWAKPKNVFGLIAIPIQIGLISGRNFARTFREYDELAKHGHTVANLSP
ncbi:MAG: hypothetical protein DMF71_04115 [Acidobacteria bacterium]|nr:MAG: hypothetical protein DMF71_04115 [Acidobacteriota bacterium]